MAEFAFPKSVTSVSYCTQRPISSVSAGACRRGPAGTAPFDREPAEAGHARLEARRPRTSAKSPSRRSAADRWSPRPRPAVAPAGRAHGGPLGWPTWGGPFGRLDTKAGSPSVPLIPICASSSAGTKRRWNSRLKSFERHRPGVLVGLPRAPRHCKRPVRRGELRIARRVRAGETGGFAGGSQPIERACFAAVDQLEDRPNDVAGRVGQQQAKPFRRPRASKHHPRHRHRCRGEGDMVPAVAVAKRQLAQSVAHTDGDVVHAHPRRTGVLDDRAPWACCMCAATHRPSAGRLRAREGFRRGRAGAPGGVDRGIAASLSLTPTRAAVQTVRVEVLRHE
jgi:hypothetical protein